MDVRRNSPTRDSRQRPVRLGLAGLLAGALTVAVGCAGGGVAGATGSFQDVVVSGPGGAAVAVGVVDRAGGTVLAALPIVSGVAARLPVGAHLPAGWSATPHRSLAPASTEDAQSGTTQPESTQPGTTQPVTTQPESTLRATLGLPADGAEGAGTTVAVVDTGIADVPDLAGRVTDRVNLTAAPAGDGHGHGTFMAGLIAGSGAASGGAYRGAAPAAELIDVKVADEHGSTDLITVLRGLQWVDDHARSIDVLNLALSSGSPLPYQVDPLTQALEALWRQGVVVVVPSGNTGPSAGSVTSPGTDPTLLTVGGLDEAGTAGRSDDTVADWSGRSAPGSPSKPDLVAPGAHLVSLLAPGSDVSRSTTATRVGNGYLRGSGTSMSTAVTSGVLAGVLARRSTLRPDAVKGLLTSTAYSSAGLLAPGAAGGGGLDAGEALRTVATYRPGSQQPDPVAPGLDRGEWLALDKAIRGGDGPAALTAYKKLSPESRAWASRAWADLDPASRPWASRAWASRAWASRAWAGIEGTDDEWASRAWASRAWASRAWASRAWAGDDWASRAWASRAWAGDEWASRAWASRAWAGDDWASRAWAGDEWASRAWASRAWAGDEWASRAWAGDDWASRAWASGEWSSRAWAWLPPAA